MRGYNQQKDSTNSNPQDSFLTKNIEDYTIKDCEDFLAKYPKDIDADKVRKRLEQQQHRKDSGGKTFYSKDDPKDRKKVLQKQNNEGSELYIRKAIIPGTILKIQTAIGARVKKEDSLFEAMIFGSKERVLSGVEGIVDEILVKEGDKVEEGTPLVKISLTPKIRNNSKDIFWVIIGLIILILGTLIGLNAMFDSSSSTPNKIAGGIWTLICGGPSLLVMVFLIGDLCKKKN